MYVSFGALGSAVGFTVFLLWAQLSVLRFSALWAPLSFLRFLVLWVLVKNWDLFDVGFSCQQQQLMINYSKVRESVQKNFSKKSLGKTALANRSHTSSMNIKVTQDPSEQLVLPLKTIFKDKTEAILAKPYQPLQYSQQKKHSVKLQSNEKENHCRKKINLPYDITIFRPFQETNRYLETERIPKEAKNTTPAKQNLKLRSEYPDQKQMRTDYTEATPQKFKKEVSTKHTTENERKLMRIPAQELKGLMDELVREQRCVAELRRQLEFYRQHAAKEHGNPVLCALKV